MISSNIVSSIICNTFSREIGKQQSKYTPQMAILVDFSLSIDYDKEDGYRHVQMLIWAEFNYVGVFCKETWNVRPRIFDHDDVNKELEPGEYEKSESEWTSYSYHDSGWVGGVERILWEYERRILTVNCFGTRGWYSKLALTEDDVAMLRVALERK